MVGNARVKAEWRRLITNGADGFMSLCVTYISRVRAGPRQKLMTALKVRTSLGIIPSIFKTNEVHCKAASECQHVGELIDRRIESSVPHES